MGHTFSSKYDWVLILMIIGLFQGCGTWPVATPAPIQTFLLSAELPPEVPGEGSKGKMAGTLLVSLPTAQPGFTSQRMAYVKRDHEIQYFAVNQWADSPARMLQPLLVNRLEQTHLWNNVVQMPSAARGDYQLSSEQLLLQQEFMQQPSRIRIHLRMQLIRLHDYRVVGTREFTVIEQTASDDPYGGVQAANSAVAKLFDETADWLSHCMRNPTGSSC